MSTPRKLRVLVLDLVTHTPAKALFPRIMLANMAGIMPQVVAVWAEQEGHEVDYVCFHGQKTLAQELDAKTFDVLVVSAFTQSAQLAYAISAWARKTKNAVTVLGGPHARCYPEDARLYFDHVLGFTDQALLAKVLESGPSRPEGRLHAAPEQPQTLPGLEARWKFQKQLLDKSKGLTVVPLIASLGCPYTCPFCIDATVKYQPLGIEGLQADLRFLQKNAPQALVSFYDPNFAVRFDQTMAAIEEVAAEGPTIRYIAESSLAILKKDRLQRMAKGGFVAALPGIETWNDLGGKAGHQRTGLDKVHEVASHLNEVLAHVPYLQANFVLGLDCDEGSMPFELTREFVDLSPGTFPGYSLLTAFGRASPLNLDYQREGRVLPFPHHFLNNNLAMNVKPKNYGWVEFYDHLIGLVEHTFAPSRLYRRFGGTKFMTTRWVNLLRGVSAEGHGRLRYHRSVRDALVNDRQVRDFFEGESTVIPDRYVARVQADLGPWWEHLPEGALTHDPNAWHSSEAAVQASK